MSNNETRPRFRPTQETIAIITVGLALAGLQFATVADLREEAHMDRAAAQATAAADRAAWQAESRQLRDEARADREDFQRQARDDRQKFDQRMEALQQKFHQRMEALQRQVVGLSIEHAKLAARSGEEH